MRTHEAHPVSPKVVHAMYIARPRLRCAPMIWISVASAITATRAGVPRASSPCASPTYHPRSVRSSRRGVRERGYYSATPAAIFGV